MPIKATIRVDACYCRQAEVAVHFAPQLIRFYVLTTFCLSSRKLCTIQTGFRVNVLEILDQKNGRGMDGYLETFRVTQIWCLSNFFALGHEQKMITLIVISGRAPGNILSLVAKALTFLTFLTISYISSSVTHYLITRQGRCLPPYPTNKTQKPAI
jgi:hypothetical protein